MTVSWPTASREQHDRDKSVRRPVRQRARQPPRNSALKPRCGATSLFAVCPSTSEEVRHEGAGMFLQLSSKWHWASKPSKFLSPYQYILSRSSLCAVTIVPDCRSGLCPRIRPYKCRAPNQLGETFLLPCVCRWAFKANTTVSKYNQQT